MSETNEAAAQRRDVERLVTFSDAVYAIAITLLVLSLSVPNGPAKHLGKVLRDLRPQLLSYALSFAVIGRYWVLHHQMFRSLRRVDNTLLWVNLALLGFVALLPFPTQVLGDYGGTTLGTVVYAAALCAVGALSVLTAWYIRHAELIEPDAANYVRGQYLRGMFAVAIFAISIPLALASPTAAKFSWLLIIPAGIFARRHFKSAS